MTELLEYGPLGLLAMVLGGLYMIANRQVGPLVQDLLRTNQAVREALIEIRAALWRIEKNGRRECCGKAARQEGAIQEGARKGPASQEVPPEEIGP